MAKYRKKPIIVEAYQWFTGMGDSPGVWGGFPGQHRCVACIAGDPEWYHLTGPAVITIHREVAHVSDGDWIIDEGDGLHFYPCKPDIFDATYESVENKCINTFDCNAGDHSDACPASVLREYYYKSDLCRANLSTDADCSCWYLEGTGPYPEGFILSDDGSRKELKWREKPL